MLTLSVPAEGAGAGAGGHIAVFLNQHPGDGWMMGHGQGQNNKYPGSWALQFTYTALHLHLPVVLRL